MSTKFKFIYDGFEKNSQDIWEYDVDGNMIYHGIAKKVLKQTMIYGLLKNLPITQVVTR